MRPTLQTKPRLAERRADLDVRADGGLRVAVVADTHSHPHAKSLRWIAELHPDAILHAGDIGDPKVCEDLQGIAPLYAIRGNIDTHAADLPDVVTMDWRDGGRSVLRLLLIHIAVYGPKLRSDAAALARARGAGLVVCGHSHVPFMGRDRGLVVFNPGSIGPRRFQLPIVFGVLELAGGKLEMHHVDCESGERWSP